MLAVVAVIIVKFIRLKFFSDQFLCFSSALEMGSELVEEINGNPEMLEQSFGENPVRVKREKRRRFVSVSLSILACFWMVWFISILGVIGGLIKVLEDPSG